DKRHEAHPAEIVLAPVVFACAREAEQRLDALAAHRHDQSAADRELPLEWFRHLVATGRNQNCVERGLFGQAETAVTGDDRDVLIADVEYPALGRFGKRSVALDGKDAVRDP